MTKEAATKTRIQNINDELRSISTCTAATVTELQKLLSGETSHSQKENTRARSVKTPSARSTTRSRPGTATATRAEDVTNGPDLLPPRERYVLATQAANSALKSLSEALKTPASQRTAQAPPKSKAPTNAQKSQRPTLVHTKTSSGSQYPLKERSASQIANSPTKTKSLRRSSSFSAFTGPDPGLVATAECGRIAFAYLSTPEAIRSAGKDSPELALENGRLALVGKLVTHGLDNLAIKEMRLLKKRLEKCIGRKFEGEDARPASSRSAASQQAPLMEKEHLATLLDFGDVDYTSPAISIITNLQIYVLRVIARVKRPRLVEEAWKYLKMSYPSSPINLISHMAKKKDHQVKSARQLESLAQTILQLCPSISSSADGAELQPSPNVVLCLQHLAFGVRQQWWAIAQHQGNKEKELIEPFEKCLIAFARRSTSPALKKYKLAESLYSNLLGSGDSTDFSHRDDASQSGAQNSTLASLARAANLPDEALRWLGTSPSSMAESPVAVTIHSIRAATISLEGCLKTRKVTNQDETIDAALGALSGSLNGTPRDLETLLMEVHALRRVATKILSTPPPAENTSSSLALQQLAVNIVAASVRFSRRFIGSKPPDDACKRTKASYQTHLEMAVKLERGIIDSVSACCRLPVTAEAKWVELDSLIQDCLRFVAQVEGEISTGFMPHDSTHGPYVKFSNLYWVLRRQLQNLDCKSHPALKAMKRSTELLQPRPQAEQEAGQLILKLERLGEELANLDQVQGSRDAFKQCIEGSLNDSLVSELEAVTSNCHIRHIFGSNHLFSDLGRVLKLYIRSFARNGVGQSDELAFFDDCNHTAAVRGALLEWQLVLYQQILSRQRAWDPAVNDSIRTIVERLLSMYEPVQFPIRRQRLHLLLLQLSHMHPDIVSEAHVQDQFQHENDISAQKTADRKLSRFGDHLKSLLTLKTLLQQGDVTSQKFRDCFSTWQSMLQSANTWEEVAEKIDDADHWLEAIQASFDLLCAKGEDYEALPVLHLLVRILELQNNPDSSRLVTTLCTLGLQFLRLGYSGKAGLAFAKAEIFLSNESTSTEARLRWHLGYAEYLLAIGNAAKCQMTLSAAEILARNDKRFMDLSRSSASLSGRMSFHRMIADACYVSSLLSSKGGDHKSASRYARQAVKVNRHIWATLEHNANTRKTLSASCSNTASEEDKSAPVTTSITHEALKGPDFWSIIPSLYRALTQHSVIIASQGLLDEAIYVLQQAEKVVSAIGSRPFLVDNASRLAELWVQSGRPDKAQPLLDGLDMSSSETHFSMIPYHMSLTKIHHASQNFEDEMAGYDMLEKLLHQLSSPSFLASMESFTCDLDALTSNVSALTLDEIKREEIKPVRGTRGRATATKTVAKTIAKTTTRATRKAPLKTTTTAVSRVPKKTTPQPITEKQSADDRCTSLDTFQTEIDYRRVATHLLQGDVVKAVNVLNKIQSLNQDRDGSHAWVHFKAMLAQAIKSIAEDFTFNTLPESTIAFPSIPQEERRASEGVATKRPVAKLSAKNARSRPQAGDSFVQLIQTAREKLVEAHTQYATAASNHVFRQLSAALSHATVLLSAVSQGRIRGSIHPLYSAYMSELPKHHALALAQSSVEVEHEPLSREVYLQWPTPNVNQPLLSSPSDFQHDYIDIIPETWTAVSVALSEEQDEIYITRYERGLSPFVLRLPLARHSSRDLDEGEFTFADGKRELEEIIELSDFTTRNAKNLNSSEGRKQWWEDRQALDTKLRELLLNIENIWLGGFRGIFSDHVRQPALLARFRKSFDNILSRHLPSRQKKSSQKKPSLDPRVFELFVGLGDASNAELDLDEGLTDLIYFVVDILQFNGEPNAVDEIDFDSMVIETRDALSAYHHNAQKASSSSHTILILDKNLHMLPWESLPCLENVSISRLPSLAALRERLLVARSPTTNPDAPAGHYISASAGGTSMLNPSGDLKHTSKTIQPHLNALDGSWTHIANRPPSEQEFEESLKNEQLLLYFGHGSGLQYIRSKTVRHLYLQSKAYAEKEEGERKPGCATTFLFGCSSVHLSENGIYEPSGMLSSYLTAGAPAVLGMLWDVTDKDCDRLAVRAGELWGLWPEAEVEEASPEPPPTVRKKKGKGRVAQLAEVDTPRASSRSRKGKADGAGDGVSRIGRRGGVGLDEAVRDARKACVLRYLNGAAAVVYGIPVYLE